MDAQVAARLAALEEVFLHVPYEYSNRERLRNDVTSLLRICSTLQPNSETFSGGGRSMRLFYLYGVLPITYKNATFNIPVTIYFDPPYPKQAPRCFVTPTAGMALKKAHPHVDQGGMIYVPYLASWNERSSALTELIGVLTSVFSSAPPVYATMVTPRSMSPAGHGHARAQDLPVISVGSRGRQDMTPQRGSGPQGGYPPQGGPPRRSTSQPPARPAAAVAPRTRKEAAVLSVTEDVRQRWPALVGPIVRQVNEELETRARLQAEAARLQQQDEASGRRGGHETDHAAAEAGLRAFVERLAGRELEQGESRAETDLDCRQVLDCLAEERALEELLTALDDLLAARKVAIADFLREVRDVSRRQYMCRVQRLKATAAITAAVSAGAAGAPGA